MMVLFYTITRHQIHLYQFKSRIINLKTNGKKYLSFNLHHLQF